MPRTDQLTDKSDTGRAGREPVTGFLDRVRTNRTGRLALRTGIGALGTLVVALGVVLIPFPGPGWAIVILGLAIWAMEFAWAKSLLQFTKRHVRSWTRWVTRRSVAVRALVGVVGMIFVGFVVWTSVRLSLDVDLAVIVRDWVTGS